MKQAHSLRQAEFLAELQVAAPDWSYLLGLHLQLAELEKLLDGLDLPL